MVTLFYRRHRSPCMYRATLSDLLLSLRVLLQLTWRNRFKKIATHRHWLGSKVRSAVTVTIVGSSGASQGHETLPTDLYMGVQDYSAFAFSSTLFQVIHSDVRHSFWCIKPHINCCNKKALQPDLIWRVPCYCQCSLSRFPLQPSAAPSTLFSTTSFAVLVCFRPVVFSLLAARANARACRVGVGGAVNFTTFANPILRRSRFLRVASRYRVWMH